MLKTIKKLLKSKKNKVGTKLYHHEFGKGKITKIIERDSMNGKIRFLKIKFDTANLVLNEANLKAAKVERK